jgi:hypothetical protein
MKRKWLRGRCRHVVALNRHVGSPLFWAVLIGAIMLGALMEIEGKRIKIAPVLGVRETSVRRTEFSSVRVVENIEVPDPSPDEQVSVVVHDGLNLVWPKIEKRIKPCSRTDYAVPVSIISKIVIVKAIVNKLAFLQADICFFHDFCTWRYSRIFKVAGNTRERHGFWIVWGRFFGQQSEMRAANVGALNRSQSLVTNFGREFSISPEFPSNSCVDCGYNQSSNFQMVAPFLGCAALLFIGAVLFDYGLRYENADSVAGIIMFAGFALCTCGFILVLESPVFWHMVSP